MKALSELKVSPAPWYVGKFGQYIFDNDDNEIACVDVDNEKLVAEAPAMYEAARELLERMECGEEITEWIMHYADRLENILDKIAGEKK